MTSTDIDRSPLMIGCDHAAYPLKETIKAYLQEQGIGVEDVGAHDTASVDYPGYGQRVAEGVSSGRYRRGILLCGTGIGMSMVANKYAGVRAALCSEPFAAEMSRRHNDANILVLGGRTVGETLALETVRVWLATPFEGGRHQKRIDQFSGLGSPSSSSADMTSQQRESSS